MTNARDVCLSALIKINEDNLLSHIVIKDTLDKYDYLESRDKAFIKRVINGTLEYQIQLDYFIDSFSKLPVNKMKPYVRNLIRMSVYQILYMDKIPDSAAINEAVKLIKNKYSGLVSFTNGLLRNISRNKDKLSISERNIKYSIPEWMLNLIDESIGRDSSDRFLNNSLSDSTVYARKINTDAFAKLDDLNGFIASDDWKEGRYIIQDKSSAVPVIKAGIKEGDTILDVCAAPGGKSIQAAEKTGPDGIVYSFDKSEDKISLIKQNAERCKFKNIVVKVQDATVYNDEYAGKADVIIADLPCSGLGTISHKPDVKLKTKEKDIEELAKLQYSILCNVQRYLKPGGRLIYSTCTIDKTENHDNIVRFLNEYRNFVLTEEETLIPDDSDGFYIACMTLKSTT